MLSFLRRERSEVPVDEEKHYSSYSILSGAEDWWGIHEFHKPFNFLNPEESGFGGQELYRLHVSKPDLSVYPSNADLADIVTIPGQGNHSDTFISRQDYHNGTRSGGGINADARFFIEVQTGIETTWPIVELFLNKNYGPVAIQACGTAGEGRLASKIADGHNHAESFYKSPPEGLSFIFDRLIKNHCARDEDVTPEMVKDSLLTSANLPLEVKGMFAQVYQGVSRGEAAFYNGLAK